MAIESHLLQQFLKKQNLKKKKNSLRAWKARVGYTEASRISRESTSRGDKMHKHLEDALHGKQHLDFVEISDVEKKMSEVIINQALEKKLNEIWGCETPLYYPYSHAGTTDLCGVYDNNESIIDFKSGKTLPNAVLTDGDKAAFIVSISSSVKSVVPLKAVLF